MLAVTAQAQTAPLPRGADRASDAIRPLLGAWDLELVGASRLCTVTLAAENATQGRQIRFPAICRRALPILAEVQGWSLTPKGQPRLDDASGKPVITFEQAGSEKSLRGQGSDGKTYALDPKDYPRAVRRAATRAETPPEASRRPTAIDLAKAPSPESVPGRYVIMRQQNREACRISLEPGATSSGGDALARFEGSCQDTGLMIFDPAGWRYAAGRLRLIARKGHSVELIFEDGQWRKDPPLGAPLLLRKLP